MNRTLAKTTGLDAGKLLFGQVHDALGGNVKWLISGGAALPKETYDTFARVGLRLSEGYGLTEAAPVLTVAKPSSSGVAGNVERPSQASTCASTRRTRTASARSSPADRT